MPAFAAPLAGASLVPPCRNLERSMYAASAASSELRGAFWSEPKSSCAPSGTDGGSGPKDARKLPPGPPTAKRCVAASGLRPYALSSGDEKKGQTRCDKMSSMHCARGRAWGEESRQTPTEARIDGPHRRHQRGSRRLHGRTGRWRLDSADLDHVILWLLLAAKIEHGRRRGWRTK